MHKKKFSAPLIGAYIPSGIEARNFFGVFKIGKECRGRSSRKLLDFEMLNFKRMYILYETWMLQPKPKAFDY